MRFRRPAGKRLAKIANIATLLSFVTSLFTFVPMMPVRAASGDPLESLRTTLAQPIFSADWDTDPSFTNVTYDWALSDTFGAGPSDPCLTTDDCFKFVIDLEDSGIVANHQMQEWRNGIVADDVIWNGPIDMAVASTSRVDTNLNLRYETLEIFVDCLSPCAMVTSTEYSLTIVNSPIKNPTQPQGYVEGQYTSLEQRLTVDDQSTFDLTNQLLTSIVAIGKGITVTASVDPTLTFSVDGVIPSTAFYNDISDIDNSNSPDSCDFGTLTPAVPKVCLFHLNIATNASNGYAIYVVQDQDMTFNGNTIKKFYNGTRLNYSEASTWAPPSAASLAHLGYSSDDTDVLPDSFGDARWAGIPKIATASQAPNLLGLVANSPSPGDDQWTYALKIESASTLPQGTGYTHNEYFIVVGNF